MIFELVCASRRKPIRENGVQSSDEVDPIRVHIGGLRADDLLGLQLREGKDRQQGYLGPAESRSREERRDGSSTSLEAKKL